MIQIRDPSPLVAVSKRNRGQRPTHVDQTSILDGLPTLYWTVVAPPTIRNRYAIVAATTTGTPPLKTNFAQGCRALSLCDSRSLSSRKIAMPANTTYPRLVRMKVGRSILWRTFYMHSRLYIPEFKRWRNLVTINELPRLHSQNNLEFFQG